MNIRITSSELDRIKSHAREGYPHEVVGILAGRRKDNYVSKARPLINERSDTHNRYKVSALSLFRAEQQLEEKTR